MTTAAVTARNTADLIEPGFAATLRSEWTKLRSVRSTWIIVTLAVVLPVGVSALVALVTGMTFDSWGAGAQSSYDPVTTSMSSLLFRMILMVVLGVTTVTSEYGTGMIRTTFTVNPRRTEVLVAKGVILAALALAIGAITVPGMFLASQPILAAYGLPTASITDSDTARTLIVYAFGQALLYTLVPFLVAWILRGTASAITAALGFLMLPAMLSPLMPEWMQANVLRYFPDMAVNSLAWTNEAGSATYLSQAPAIVVVALWLLGLFAAAATTLNRRDV